MAKQFGILGILEGYLLQLCASRERFLYTNVVS